MPLIAAAATAGATRRRASSNGTGFWHSTYLGANRYRPDAAPPPAPGALYPMAFLVEQDAGSTVSAHFHQADQFQVMLAGEGTLGTHEVGPVAVHFTAAFSAYGPIRAGADGLTYFTLRNGWDPGARYMPGARTELPRPRRHREAVGAPDAVPADPAALAAGASICVPALKQEPDGLAAWRYRLPAGAHLAGPDPAAGAGQDLGGAGGHAAPRRRRPAAAVLPVRQPRRTGPDGGRRRRRDGGARAAIPPPPDARQQRLNTNGRNDRRRDTFGFASIGSGPDPVLRRETSVCRWPGHSRPSRCPPDQRHRTDSRYHRRPI